MPNIHQWSDGPMYSSFFYRHIEVSNINKPNVVRKVRLLKPKCVEQKV